MNHVMADVAWTRQSASAARTRGIRASDTLVVTSRWGEV